MAASSSGKLNPGAVEEAIEQLKQENSNFHMEGSSWTNDRSWVKGYENVLTPMAQLSALFHRKVDPLRRKTTLPNSRGIAAPCSTTSCWNRATSATGDREHGRITRGRSSGVGNMCFTASSSRNSDDALGRAGLQPRHGKRSSLGALAPEGTWLQGLKAPLVGIPDAAGLKPRPSAPPW